MNFGLDLAEAPTFARNDGLVDVTIFKLKHDAGHAEDVPLQDLLKC
jgi:hypothetical protein